MRILIVNDTYYPQVNGCSYFTQRLVHYLHKRGHDIAVIGPSESFKHNKTTIDGVPVYQIRSTQFLFWNNWGFRYCLPWGNKKFIEAAIDEFKPDIAHFQGHFPIARNTLAVCKARKIPVVATNHFMPENLLHYVPFGEGAKKKMENFLWKDFVKIFNQIETITSPTEIAANLIRHRLKHPVKSVSNGIDCERFNPNKKNPHIREKYKIPTKPTLIYIGRLDLEKYVDEVIKALAIVLKTTDLQLVLGGKGAEVENLKKLANELGVSKNVLFLGFVSDDDLPYLYTLADCFINAGTAELQSLVTMEAMASGLPAIGVDAMALPELVLDNQNGFLFKHSDIDGLASKITKIFSDKALRERLAKNSLEMIRNKHDINKTMEIFEDIYKKEIAKKR